MRGRRIWIPLAGVALILASTSAALGLASRQRGPVQRVVRAPYGVPPCDQITPPCPRQNPAQILIQPKVLGDAGLFDPAPPDSPGLTPEWAVAAAWFGQGRGEGGSSATPFYATDRGAHENPAGTPVWVVRFEGACFRSVHAVPPGACISTTWDVEINAKSGEFLGAWTDYGP
jgi:hypothetical protein